MKIELDKINLGPKTLEDALEAIGQLVKITIELKKENDALREQLAINSANSSLPPSRDIKNKKKVKSKSARKRGGQPGHKGWQRKILPPEDVNTIVDCKPAAMCDCGGNIQL